jgi:hypothetical protein
MTTAIAQASPNIAFTMLSQWNTVSYNRQACFGYLYGEAKDKFNQNVTPLAKGP